MSRGSIISWQDYGRRNSHGVPQFSGSPVEFMTIDGIECKRGDGWFLSYTKIAAIIVVFIIGVIAAGFLGWYINSLPKKKTYDSAELLNDEILDSDVSTIGSISPFVHPLKYRLELTPTIEDSGVSELLGRVVIEFCVNDTSALSNLALNAKNIAVASYKLWALDQWEDEKRLRRRRRRAEDEFTSENGEDEATFVTTAVYSLEENSTLLSLTENQTVSSGKMTEYSSHGSAFDGESKVKGPKVSEMKKPVTSRPSLATTNSTEIEIKRYDVDNDKGMHVIHLSNNIGEGIYSLEINYKTLIDNDGFFVANFSGTSKGQWLMGTTSRPFAVRRLLPIFDDARLKSVFTVSVARPKETRVLSNMPLRTSRDTSIDTMIIDTFDETPPLAPGNLAFLMGHIEFIDERVVGDAEVTATFWGDSKRHSQGIYLHDKLDPAVINLIDVFSMPYPLPKLDLVGLPPGIDENMGSPGLISMKESLFYTTIHSPMIAKDDALNALVNLLGRQWLEGPVNVNWTDAWIFEGSLIHFQREIVEKIDSSLVPSNSFVTDVQSDAMQIDSYSISRTVDANVNHPYSRSHRDRYAKGACLIRMLHGAINDTTFRNGYKKFIARWKYGTTGVNEFWNVMEEEASDLPSGVSLEEIMTSWISQSGYPIVTVIRDYEKGSATIRQAQFTYDKPSDKSDKLWYIPLSYVSENDNWTSPEITWFSSESEMTLDSIGSNDSWVVFNIDKTGYYRVHYDDKNWKLLEIALEENHELFPPETRASLIDDVFSLAAVGLTKYETAFEFIKYMQMKERHYAPWGVLMRHVFKLNRLLYDTSAFTDFQEFMLKFVSPLYIEVGSDIKKGSRLTLTALRLACVFEHADCLEWFKSTFEYGKTEIRKIISPYIRNTFYCTIARYGTRKEWNYFIEEATTLENKEERKRFLESFACFQAPWILQSILNEVLHEETFNQDDISVILRAFPKNPAAAQAAFRFVRANWHDVAQRFTGSYSMLKTIVLSMLNGLTTERDLEDLQAFRENNYESMKGARYAAAIVEANANFVTSWLKNSLPEIEKFLKKDVAREESIRV